VLSDKLNDERRYTYLMLEVAKNNNLQVDMAWTSPDLKDPYYDEIRKSQEKFSFQRKMLNPYHIGARIMGEDMLEEYWSALSEKVLTFNIQGAETEAKCSLEELFGSDRWQRFTRYIRFNY
jgi:hypothetical protein